MKYTKEEKIALAIVNGIAEETGLDLFDTHYIDGSKFEADANKYKFRWKPDRKRERLIGKINAVISSYDSTAAVNDLESLKSYLLPLRKKCSVPLMIFFPFLVTLKASFLQRIHFSFPFSFSSKVVVSPSRMVKERSSSHFLFSSS